MFTARWMPVGTASLCAGALLGLAGCNLVDSAFKSETGGSAETTAKTRIYYIAADEVDWDYAPAGKDLMTGEEFNEEQAVFTVKGPHRIGRVYKKALYREYTDASFTHLKTRGPEEEHLGLLGPVIRAEVGDVIKVIFKNNSATQTYSMHPHGVFYDKASEGMPDPMHPESFDGVAAPGATVNYSWKVPTRAGPGPADGSSLIWPYHSHVDEPRDINSGLVGAILITAKGKLGSNGRPKDVDREIITLFTIFDENLSWYLDENIQRAEDPAGVDPEDPDFQESNLKHSINGRLYSNLLGLDMKKGERVRWYLMGMGTEVDIHTPHWHGNTVLIGGHRSDVAELFPATTQVYDMVPDDPGMWMYHCHVNDHIVAGMIAMYNVMP